MPSKTRRQQIRLPDDLAEKVRQLGELWAGVEGPLTPSAVFRVAVQKCWLMDEWRIEARRPVKAKR